jgi:hypothetical protein
MCEKIGCMEKTMNSEPLICGHFRITMDPYVAIIGEEHGAIVRAALTALATVPADVFDDAVHRVEVELAIGPVTDPSAYASGQRFENGRGWIEVLRALAALRRMIEKEAKKENER